MKKNYILVILFLLNISVYSQSKFEANTNEKKEVTTPTETKKIKTSKEKEMEGPHTIYEYKVKDINGNEFDFSKYQGYKILIVNTASECGYTPQYAQLQKLYEENKDNNFIIVAFPSNDFGNQEPGDNTQIAKFCSKNYGVTFPVMSKVNIKGDDVSPIYQYLTQQAKNGVSKSSVNWNFQKYLINERGTLDNVISSEITPLDSEIINWVKG